MLAKSGADDEQPNNSTHENTIAAQLSSCTGLWRETKARHKSELRVRSVHWCEPVHLPTCRSISEPKENTAFCIILLTPWLPPTVQ